MKYSKRELRAVDILAMVLTGVGVLCLLLAFGAWTQGLPVLEPSPEDPGRRLLGYVIGGLLFTCSGAALNLKLKEAQRLAGEKPLVAATDAGSQESADAPHA